MLSSYCIAPKCRGEAVPGTRFCATHNQAPASRRGGWLSAEKRRHELVKIDASAVAPRLWVGSRPRVDLDLPNVDTLVLCAQEIQPAQLAFHGRVLRCPLPDAEISHAELKRALVTSRLVANALVDKQRVLVTCAMGINRSAFVASLALGQVTTLSADDLIALMRARRDALCLGNAHFRAHLHRVIGAGRVPPTGNQRARRPRP